MSRTLKIYIGLLILLFIGIIVIEFSTPPPINWSKTYNETHKIPYGTYILYNELPSLFPESKIQNIKVTPYEYFDDLYDWEDNTYMTTGNYMLIDEYAFLDDISVEELLVFTSMGNSLFISSSYIPEKFADTLKIKTHNDYSLSGRAELSLANPKFKNDSITIEKGLSNIYFSKLDSTSTLTW
ncbi:MAG: hypothetical protein AAF901_14015, partial [Bacteroidota bacterium]